MHVAFRGRCDFHPLMASRVASSPVQRHAAAQRWRRGVRMLLVSIRWARRDDPVVLKKKNMQQKHDVSRQVWTETAAVSGKEKGKRQRKERRTNK